MTSESPDFSRGECQSAINTFSYNTACSFSTLLNHQPSLFDLFNPYFTTSPILISLKLQNLDLPPSQCFLAVYIFLHCIP